MDGRAVVHSRKPAANLARGPDARPVTTRPAMRICALDRVRAPSVLDLPGQAACGRASGQRFR